MVRRSRGGMEGTGDMFVASDNAFGGSRVAFSRFVASVAGCTPHRFAMVARAELRVASVRSILDLGPVHTPNVLLVHASWNEH
eukprot:6565908-Prymnesium_polylepis.1